ncbi:MAG: ParA family protein [Lachnospiraceae bacterium]|nr:ParA family protein [Lachnospiraceae bacterium]
MKNKTIAIIGSPGCGKTSNAVKLAMSLAKHNQNVVIVSLECSVPAIPYLLSNFEEQSASLGDLLTRAALSQQEIASACMTVPKQNHISVLGYQFGDFRAKFPAMVYERVHDFAFQLKSLVPYIIVDCASSIEDDPASNLFLQEADMILRFGSADLKGMSCFNTLDKLLDNQASFPREKQLTIISNCWASQNWQRVSAVYGDVFDVLPHCPDLAYQYDEMDLFNTLASKEGLKYMDVMERIASRITGNMTTREAITEIKGEREKEKKAEKKDILLKPLRSVLNIGSRGKGAGPGQRKPGAAKPKINRKNGEW